MQHTKVTLTWSRYVLLTNYGCNPTFYSTCTWTKDTSVIITCVVAIFTCWRSLKIIAYLVSYVVAYEYFHVCQMKNWVSAWIGYPTKARILSTCSFFFVHSVHLFPNHFSGHWQQISSCSLLDGQLHCLDYHHRFTWITQPSAPWTCTASRSSCFTLVDVDLGCHQLQ